MSPVYAFLTGHLKPAVLISRVHVVFYLSALGSLVLPSACSGPVGLLHQREKSNIFSSVPMSLAFKQTREMHKFSQGLEPE